jgi:hypothetical protein
LRTRNRCLGRACAACEECGRPMITPPWPDLVVPPQVLLSFDLISWGVLKLSSLCPLRLSLDAFCRRTLQGDAHASRCHVWLPRLPAMSGFHVWLACPAATWTLQRCIRRHKLQRCELTPPRAASTAQALTPWTLDPLTLSATLNFASTLHPQRSR